VSLAEQIELGFNPLEPRDSRGRWTRFGAVGEATRVMEKNREGFSVSPFTGDAPQHGFMVALDGHTHTYPASILDDDDKLRHAIDDMLMSERESFKQPGMFLGGWVEDGKLWLDPSQNVQDPAEATRLGKARDQVGIFDLDKGETVYTGGSGGGRITEHANQGPHRSARELLGPAGRRAAGGGGRDHDALARGIGAQLELAGGGWETAWMHELRGLDGKWIRGDELAQAGRQAKVSAVIAGDAILAYADNGDAKPFEVTHVYDKDGNRKISVRDPDTREIKVLTLGLNDDVRILGFKSNGKMHSMNPPMPKHDALHDAFTQIEKKFNSDFATGVKSETKPHAPASMKDTPGRKYFGNTADTSVVTFNNGAKYVRKRDLRPAEVTNEILGSKVGRAVGAGPPLAFLHDDAKNPDEPANWPPEKNVLWMQYVPGKPAIEWMGGVDANLDPIGDKEPLDMLETPEGRRIGVLDNLTGNGDRHYGNWMVAKRKDGTEYPVPIDHGLAGHYDGRGLAYGAGMFGEHLVGNGFDRSPLADISPGEFDQMEDNLRLLRPDFQSAGRNVDYQNMIASIESMKMQAANARLSDDERGDESVESAFGDEG
jgi:hypothetical protein